MGTRRTGQPRASEQGYALLLLILMATILLISLSAALPNIYHAGQREREEELIFRGTQYARAIALFHRQFNRYPVSVKDLVETNHLHFLRHAFRDPMSRSGKWRFIHCDANGIPLDSKTLKVPGGGNPANPGASSGQPAAAGQAIPAGSTPSNQQGLGGGFTLGQSSSSGLTPQNPPGTPGGPASSLLAPSTQIQGAFIIGVASSSTHPSIRILNGHKRYDEWEFLGTRITFTVPAIQGAPVEPGKPGQGFPTVPPGIQGPLPPRPPDAPIQNP